MASTTTRRSAGRALRQACTRFWPMKPAPPVIRTLCVMVPWPVISGSILRADRADISPVACQENFVLRAKARYVCWFGQGLRVVSVLGCVVLYAMWCSHLVLFREASLAAWIGLVVQNIVSSILNSH